MQGGGRTLPSSAKLRSHIIPYPERSLDATVGAVYAVYHALLYGEKLACPIRRSAVCVLPPPSPCPRRAPWRLGDLHSQCCLRALARTHSSRPGEVRAAASSSARTMPAHIYKWTAMLLSWPHIIHQVQRPGSTLHTHRLITAPT